MQALWASALALVFLELTRNLQDHWQCHKSGVGTQSPTWTTLDGNMMVLLFFATLVKARSLFLQLGMLEQSRIKWTAQAHNNIAQVGIKLITLWLGAQNHYHWAILLLPYIHTYIHMHVHTQKISYTLHFLWLWPGMQCWHFHACQISLVHHWRVGFPHSLYMLEWYQHQEHSKYLWNKKMFKYSVMYM